MRVTSLHLHRRTSYAICDKVLNSKATSKRIRAVEGNLPPEIFGMPGTLEKLQNMSSYNSKPLNQHPAWDGVSMMFQKKLFKSSTFPPTLQPKIYIYTYTMICFDMAISPGGGHGLCSQCWRDTEKAIVSAQLFFFSAVLFRPQKV